MVANVLSLGLFLVHDVVHQLHIYGLLLLQKPLVDVDVGIVDPLEVLLLGEDFVESVPDDLGRSAGKVFGYQLPVDAVFVMEVDD